MKHTKRILAVLLSLVMFCASTPFALDLGLELVPRAQAYNAGDHIQFGTYPQKRVDETSALKMAAESAHWRSYGYFSGTGLVSDGNMHPNDFWQFADFFVDGKKYRAVTFSAYRPWITGYTSDSNLQERNEYYTDVVYYFQYEPLNWRILDPSTGFIMSEVIIDAQAYQNIIYSYGEGTYHDINCSVYANDYAESSIRSWLNSDFFETAFSETQKTKIKKTVLNNQAYTSTYDSIPTNDYIFLLSWSDALNSKYGFSTSKIIRDSERQAKTTDYAKCQGIYVEDESSNWWLRTPGSVGHMACQVNGFGSMWSSYDTCFCNAVEGIRPACILTDLNSDIEFADNLFSSEVHVHDSSIYVKANIMPATCTENGSFDEVTYCSLCGKEMSKIYKTIEPIGHTANIAVIENQKKATCTKEGSYDSVVYCLVCDKEISRETIIVDKTEHHSVTHTQPSTCSVRGYTITTCSACDEQLDFEVLPLAAHQYGAWVTVKEPTTTEKGQRERTCTVCGIAKETEDIPVLEQLVAKDEPSGITVSFDEGTYEEDVVELRVEEVFDGSQYLTQSYGKIDSWNIKTYINGEEAQPGQPVTVRIPLPEGYDPNNIAVFHVNSKTGQSERIEDVRVEDGYIVFTAASFSVYIVVDESSAVQSDPEPDPNTCPWCGKVHSGFFGGLIAFFHRIFARLFGAKY